MTLKLEDYASAIALRVPVARPVPLAVSEVPEAAAQLLMAFGGGQSDEPLRALRGVLTARTPYPIAPQVAALLDRLLQSVAPPVTDVAGLTRFGPGQRFSLWRGDITTLAVDAIVNAANSALLGCFIPFHACIDNAIHWAAGPQLRADCDTIITLQCHSEPTGTAKATRGYNLPARFVLHTVGPIVRGPLGNGDREALASSYRACLDLAAELDITSLAFCAISTGVFGFPKPDAARIALDTVADWLESRTSPLHVIFNVFSADDEAVYYAAMAERSWTR